MKKKKKEDDQHLGKNGKDRRTYESGKSRDDEARGVLNVWGVSSFMGENGKNSIIEN